jgi:hypothetical protein
MLSVNGNGRYISYIRNMRLKSLALTALVGFSVLWTVLDWSRFDLIKERARELAWLGSGLLISEVCFIAGALVMTVSLGVEVAGNNRVHGWWKKLRYARREVKSMAQEAVASRLFGFGFWLNFVGAVGTSILLALSVIKFIPLAGWGLLVLVIIDLVATFSWRIPVHIARRSRNAKS